ncbi:MAG: type II toxin-antitoxin system RelE/ParE family toxin [Burkholderiales bacterium]|nr:type II toxin-antitoxin system RelE/ParE family toxin [Burkholderiales bacterium]
MKRLEWIGDSLERLRELEPRAKHLAGYQLERVQAGKAPSDCTPMPSAGLGVSEIRVRTTGAYRVFDVAKLVEAVYVLHAFQKKGNKTPMEDLELGRRRFGALVCVFRPNVTGRFGIVTDRFGNVTGDSGGS